MAVSTFGLYGAAAEGIMDGTIALESDSFRAVLLTSSYTPNQSTHAAWSSLSTYQVSTGNGYTANGASVTISVTRSGLVVTVDTGDVTWTPGVGETLTAKYFVIMKDANADGTIASTDIPIGLMDLNFGGASASATNDDFTVGIHASGLFTATALAIA